MVFDGTIYNGNTTIWKIRVSPQGIKEDEPAELFRVWMPGGEKDNHKRWVFYNPRIALLVIHRYDKNTKYYIPMSMLYAMKDALKVMYNRLSSKDIYSKVNGQIYMSEQAANENKIKVTMFSDSVVLSPIMIEKEENEVTVYKRGVKIESLQDPDRAPLEIEVIELKTIYEVLDRLDINTYSLILSLAEQLGEMDQKLDKVLELQTKILKLIEKESLKDFQDKFTVEW